MPPKYPNFSLTILQTHRGESKLKYLRKQTNKSMVGFTSPGLSFPFSTQSPLDMSEQHLHYEENTQFAKGLLSKMGIFPTVVKCIQKNMLLWYLCVHYSIHRKLRVASKPFAGYLDLLQLWANFTSIISVGQCSIREQKASRDSGVSFCVSFWRR